MTYGNTVVYTQSLDPWHNLALEERIFEERPEGMNLYLWQNQNTVVIGRNQNAWKECRLEPLERDGGRLARRTSGGGAVFHDVGNLNFTFTAPKALYDLPRQLGVILSAVRALGVDARFTGRNDLVTQDGAKFSGNAFRHSDKTSMHHGTLLIDVDMSRLSRYLSPSPEKLKAKGVESVRARVCNLRERRPDLTVQAAKAAVIDAFAREYGAFTPLEESALNAAALAEARERHASWEWRMGGSPQFDWELSTRFPWGALELQLCLRQGRVTGVRAYSDAMDEAFIRALEPALTGRRLCGGELAAAADALGGELARDVAGWLREKEP